MARDVGALQLSGLDIGALQSVASVLQTIDPTSIASAESFGSPFLDATLGFDGIATAASFGSPNIAEAETIAPGAGIPSGSSFGTPTISYPSSIVFGAGIPTGIAIGVPNVGGPFSLSGIPTGQSLGLPLINQPVDLGFFGIATTEALGAPALAHSSTIQPGSIATAASFGSLLISGGKQKPTFVTGIPSAASFGTPTITPATEGLRIFIAGVDCSSFGQASGTRKAGLLRLGASGSAASSAGSAQPLRIVSQTIGRWEATFDMIDHDGTFLPVLGQTVLIIEPGYRLFAGCVTKLERELIVSTTALIYHFTARDKSAICDRRLVKTPFYPAGMDVADVFRDIVANYLNGEGITTQNVPATLGALETDFTLPGQLATVTVAFDSLVTLYNGVWYIDSFGDLHTPPISDIADAPYSLVSPTTNAIGLREIEDSSAYANKIYAVSNVPTQPGTSGGTPAAPGPSTITETYTLPQAEAAARGFVIGSIVTQFPIDTIVSLKVNGVAQPVHTGIEFINFRQSWWYFPGAPNVYVYPPNAANDVPEFSLPPITSAYPIAGDVVEIVYVTPQASGLTSTPQLAAGEALAVADGVTGGTGTGTCGSGVWEKVEQVQNVQFQGDLQVIANAVLDRDGTIQKQLTFQIDYPGGQVGSKLHVDLPRLNLADTDLMITSLSGASQQGVQLGHGTCIRWTALAVSGADQGNAVKYFERVLALLQLPRPRTLPVLPTMVLAPGTNLSSGTVSTNPLIVGATCLATEVALSAWEPAVDEDVIIDLTLGVGGASIFSSPAVLPVGTAARQVVVWSKMASSSGVWLPQNSVLVPVISYRVTGANPAPPQSVSVQVRGRF